LEPIGGTLADRTNRRIFPYGLLIVAIAMSCVGLAPSYVALVLLVLVGAVGQSLFGPQATSQATLSSKASRGFGLRSTGSLAVAVFLAGGSLGAAVGPVAVASVVSAGGVRSTWLMVLPGLLLAALLVQRFDARLAGPDPARLAFDARALVSSAPVLALAAVLVLRSAAEMAILAFLPILVEQKGGNLMAIGATVSFFKLAGAGGALLGGYLSDRARWKPVMVLLLVLAAVLLIAFLRTEGILSLILVALLGACLLSSSAYTMVAAQNLLPDRASTAAGLVFSLSLLGGGLGALAEGFLADRFGVEPALLLIGVSLSLTAAVATLGLRER
jgi:FSR family fosmidomycin resistance protein-like MFS transporter